ncbi:hypothetical protein ACRRTK_020714 [Alexandromys fortis]
MLGKQYSTNQAPSPGRKLTLLDGSRESAQIYRDNHSLPANCPQEDSFSQTSHCLSFNMKPNVPVAKSLP